MAIQKRTSGMKFIYSSLILFFAFSFLIVLFHSTSRLSNSKPAEAKLSTSMDMMADWFDTVQRDRGDFIYDISVPEGDAFRGNNIVRQAGSLYALGQYYAYTKDAETKATLKRGFSYFRSLAEDQDSGTAIVYEDTKKSNASALLLLGLLEYIEAEPNESTDERVFAKELANYLVSTQTKKGSYIQQFEPEMIESDYNNGETMYALIRAYKVFKDPSYLASAEKAAAYFEQYYGEKGFVPAYYSWGMAGFAHLYKVQPKESYWEFMKQITDEYLEERANKIQAYIADGKGKQPRPSASVFLEGAAHTAWIAKERDPKYHAKLQGYINETLQYLTIYQPGNASSPIKTNKKRLKGGVCKDIECSGVRIDFTQHNLSAIYLYLTKVK